MNNEFLKTKIFVKDILDNWLIKSIETCFDSMKFDNSKGTPLSAYLLLSCAIDIVAGFYEGRDPKKRDNDIGEQYRKYVGKYMKNYNPQILYKDLRCGLTHNFIIGNILGLTHNHPELHNKRDIDGRVIKNFESFFDDFKIGFEQYFKDLDQDDDLQRRFMFRFEKGGIVALTGTDFKKQDINIEGPANLSSIQLSGDIYHL